LAPTRLIAASDFSPVQLASAIEQRAEATSFADLTRFGEAAARGSDRESLRRLEHISLVLLNQSEYAQFDHWNGLLARNALRQHDHRYEVMAALNALKARADNGDPAARPITERIARNETDWFARIHAITFVATALIKDNRTGEALKLLSWSEDLIPTGDVDAAAAESDIWETIGLGLMSLKDLEGSAKAFQRADIDLSNAAYPRPDFDDVYNMAHLAILLGDARLAHGLVGVHHRLALRSDLPHLLAWDQNLCAMAAESFAGPRDVDGCLRGLDARLTGAEFLAPSILPMRAIAAARQGDLTRARSDLAFFRTLKTTAGFEAASFDREPEMVAELMSAEGRPQAAFEMLRAYGRQRSENEARLVNAGVHQLTDELQGQLQTARQGVILQQAVVRSQRWIGLFAALLIFGAGAVLVWQRQVGRRLRAAQQKAEMASRSKGEFLANMSHEIRTPLNGVVGVADLLAAADLPERERRMAEIIRDSGQTLERLLSDVLDLAKVEAGQISIEAAPFHAGDLVRAVAELSRARADEKGLSLHTEIAAGLEDWFVGDAVRVRQILGNLVNNAVKFTAAGSVTILAEAPSAGVLRLSVVDTGVGFDAAQKERLFGRFQQADGSITRRFGGTGLGLSICRQLAALMQGTLDCDSQPGRGSRFWFEAPFASAAPQIAAAEDLRPALTDDRALRILVADDHATNLIVVRLMLEQLGIDIVTVEDGAQAVEITGREQFDAVLMDMQMPVMDGLEATRRIREAEVMEGRPRTPILMLTANASADHREAARVAGADGHVAKPITVAALTAALSEVLDGGCHGDDDRGPLSAAA
jgi:signal transduction histidine kinase/ActR/RegA family two-component response regulator